MQTFNTDKEIKEYIEKNIDSIKLLDECRLYKEEQLQITEEVMRIRNSIEWIIRINKVIHNYNPPFCERHRWGYETRLATFAF